MTTTLPTTTASSSAAAVAGTANNSRLMLDVQANDTHTVPFEVFEASQAQLREAAVALSKHKSSLASALSEVNNLRAMVTALEKNVDALKLQNEDLFQQLRESRDNEDEMLKQVTKLTETTEFLSQQLQMHAKTSAQRYSALLELKEQSEASLRLKLDRINAELLSSQQPNSRVIPWSMTFKQHEHPAHVVRMVVAADAQRENRMLRLQMNSNDPLQFQKEQQQREPGGSNLTSGDLADLERLVNAANDQELLLDAQAEDDLNLTDVSGREGKGAGTAGRNFTSSSSAVGSSAFSEDANTWRTICRRLHQVLSERRSLLKTKSDGPLEFLLRSRHEMAASTVQMRDDVRKINVVLNTLIERMEGRSVTAAEMQFAAAGAATTTSNINTNNINNSGNNDANSLLSAPGGAAMQRMLEGSIESLQTVISDMSHTVQRCILTNFSDADRVLFRIRDHLGENSAVNRRHSMTARTGGSAVQQMQQQQQMMRQEYSMSNLVASSSGTMTPRRSSGSFAKSPADRSKALSLL